MATALLILMVALVSLLETLAFIAVSVDVDRAVEGDVLVTGSANYTIRDVIDDGTGMTRLMLEIN